MKAQMLASRTASAFRRTDGVMKKPTKEEFIAFSKQEYVTLIQDYLNECEAVSLRSMADKQSYELAAWPYYQAHELGAQQIIKKLREFIKIND